MKVAHIVNSFDPAGSVVRCVAELNRYSAHSHSLLIRDRHPRQDTYQFPEPDRPGWTMAPGEPEALIAEADVIIHHFKGWEPGWGDPGKPSAFRNVNIYWNPNDDRFWSDSQYNAHSLDRYKLLASSHIGARQFLGEDRFQWLPDLVPLDGPYQADFTQRPVAVSYIKHAAELREKQFGDGVLTLDCSDRAHGLVLETRRTQATVVIDNVCDGHYGLAGQEAAILGLPVVVFNHPVTMEGLKDWDMDGPGFPFVQAHTIDEAAETAARLAASWSGGGPNPKIRRWAERFLDPARLIRDWWDPFAEELAS